MTTDLFLYKHLIARIGGAVIGHEKISGGRRSMDGPRAFPGIRSCLATARKQGRGMLEVLTAAFEGQPWLPPAVGPFSRLATVAPCVARVAAPNLGRPRPAAHAQPAPLPAGGHGRLSERGRRQARELGERRRNDGIAAVFTSDLQRAVETAQIAFAGSDIPVYQDPRVRECDYGALNGMPVSRLAAERSRHVHEPFPEGQSYRQVVDQMRDFLRALAADWDARRVLLISHSANRWALDCLLGGASLEDLIDAPFAWQAGWEYELPAGWVG